MTRSVLAVDEQEATFIREVFQLYIANNGGKSVARELNSRGHWYRKGKPWSKDLVLKVLEEFAVAGTYLWGKYDAKTRRKKARSEWLPLKVDPIVEPALFDLVGRLRSQRGPTRNPGRAPSPEMLLRGLVRCGKCGSSYTLESSGKKVKGEVYQYRYYNCRTACRVGKEACPGGRVSAARLDSAVTGFIVSVVCTGDRCAALIGPQQSEISSAITYQTFASIQEAWSTMIRGDPIVARNYLHHLVEQIEVDENRITVFPKEAYQAMA